MGQIQIMTEALANQIAAGEVVERPASCIKELIENSLDAGAKSILVQLEEGGIRRMRVQDDGRGMDRDDLSLAILRHATSKVKSARDLTRIATLGFRGEALASISAVARVTLQSRSGDQEEGYEVRVEGSRTLNSPQPVGMPKGTVVLVEDLFYNTPARLKYLRAVSTEQARCVEAVQRAALSRCDVRFRVEVDGRVLFQTTGDGRPQSVLAALYGVGEASQLIPVETKTTDYRIFGYVGRPTQGKASRNHGYLFINHRAIRNVAVHQAVVAGYGQRLMVGRHPVYALYLEMDPSLVDVNIHPHKSEVRFSEERDLVQAVQQGVRSVLDETFLVPDVRFQPNQSLSDSPKSLYAPGQYHHAQGKPVQGTLYREVPPQVRFGTEHSKPSAVAREVYETIFATEGKDGTQRAETPGLVQSDTNAPSVANGSVTNSGISMSPSDSAEGTTRPVHDDLQELPSTAEQRKDAWALRPIGQALGMYILADDGENLYVIDQHAAHERVLYEKFTKRMLAEERYALPLLTPITLHLSPSSAALLEDEREIFAEFGLELDPFGGNSYILRTIPAIWDGLDTERLTQEMIEALADDARKADVRSAVRERLVLRACKAAIKANHRLSSMEMHALCESLSQLDDPFHCPHGRPVFIRLSNHQLEKEFRRIV